MSSNTQLPLSPFIGKKAAPRLITRSHGILRPNLMQDFSITPKLDLKVVEEFDNPVPGLIFQVAGESTGKFSIEESNQPLVAMALSDVDPTVAQFAYNPQNMAPFDIFANFKGLDGKVKGSVIAYGCQLSGNGFTQPVKDGAKRSVDFTCLNAVFIYGMGLSYTRMRGSGAQQAAPAEPSLATATTGGYLAPGNYYVQITGVTAGGETLPSQEVAINIPTGTNTNDITVTCPDVSSPITGYNVYISNYSNGERFAGVGTASSSNTVVVTALPAPLATQPPLQNTSGIWAGANDVVFSSLAGLLTIPAVNIPNVGLPYVLLKENGNVVATLDNPATNGVGYISADGTTFTVTGTSTYQCWDILTPYLP
jgi:hypothetical protein